MARALKEGCNQLKLHPHLVAPKNNLAGEAYLKYAGWEDKAKAEFLVRQGWSIIQNKQNVKAAVTKFNKAQKLDSSIDSKGIGSKSKATGITIQGEGGRKVSKRGENKGGDFRL
ncbi:MAG: hypothetical protein F6K10_26615 [Moorea sp. SIO2B7]|nr:hypothetical protein [Moorena sp. SIO2B7]